MTAPLGVPGGAPQWKHVPLGHWQGGGWHEELNSARARLSEIRRVSEIYLLKN